MDLVPSAMNEYGIDDEWMEWYLLTPAERWRESSRLWETYMMLGGSLDDEPDSQSPFFDAQAASSEPADGRPDAQIVRRGGV